VAEEVDWQEGRMQGMSKARQAIREGFMAYLS
jgi:hypothetical protein